MSINIIWIFVLFGVWKITELVIEIFTKIAEESKEADEKSKKFLFRNDL